MTLNDSPLFNASLRICGAMKQVKLLLFGLNPFQPRLTLRKERWMSGSQSGLFKLWG